MKDFNYTKFYLKNGLKCILYPRKDLHSVSIQVKVYVGSLDEAENEKGISHFIEHLPFDGTKEMPKWEDVENFMTSISGSGNAYTSNTHTKYYGTFPSQYLDKALFYYSQLVFEPLHAQDAVEKERGIILDEMKRYDDSVDQVVYRNIIENRYENDTTQFSVDVIGIKDTVSSFKPEEIHAYHESHYYPENMTIILTGKFTEEEAKDLLEKYFGKYESQGKKERKFLKEFPEYSGFKIHTKQKLDVDQYYLTVSFPGFDMMKSSYEERVKLNFLTASVASGEFFHSILWKRLREELGLVYGISLYNMEYVTRGVFLFDTSFNPKHLETILKEIYEAVEKVKTTNIVEEVFNTAKKKKLDTKEMRFDDPDNIIGTIGAFEGELEYTGRLVTFDDYFKAIEEVKFEDLTRFANQLFDWSKVNIGVVSKEDPTKVHDEISAVWNKIIKPGK